MARRLIWAEPALADLEAIADYIALDNAKAAQALVRKVFTKVEQLPTFPEMGRTAPELPDLPEYRELIVGPCRVFYRATEDRILILHAMRHERLFDVARLLAADEDAAPDSPA